MTVSAPLRLCRKDIVFALRAGMTVQKSHDHLTPAVPTFASPKSRTLTTPRDRGGGHGFRRIQWQNVVVPQRRRFWPLATVQKRYPFGTLFADLDIMNAR